MLFLLFQATGFCAVHWMVPNIYTSWCKWCSLCIFCLKIAAKWISKWWWCVRSFFSISHGNISLLLESFYPQKGHWILEIVNRGYVLICFFYIYFFRGTLLPIVSLLRELVLVCHCSLLKLHRISHFLQLMRMQGLSLWFWRYHHVFRKIL